MAVYANSGKQSSDKPTNNSLASGYLSLRFAACVAAVLSLSGCLKQTESFEAFSKQVIETETKLAASGSASAPAFAGGLDGRFVPALKHAVLSSSSYQAALAFEREAMSAIDASAADRKTQVSGGVTLGAVYEGSPTSETTPGVAAGLNAQQLLYDGGVSVAALDQAKAAALVAQAERKTQANAVALQAGKAWWDLWQYSARLRWLDEKTANTDMLLSQIERMASNGIIDRTSLDSAKRQLIDIRLQRASLHTGLASAQAQFELYFGRKPNQVNEPKQLFTQKMAVASANSWQNSPLMVKSMAELAGARAGVEAAQAAFKPKVGLKAGLISPIESGQSSDVSLGVSVDYVFGDGGRRKAQLDMAKAREKAQEQKLKELARESEMQATVFLKRLEELDKSELLLREKIEISASEAKSARSQIATGQSNLRQLIEAEIENYRATDQHIQMKAQRQVLLLEMAATLGKLENLIDL